MKREIETAVDIIHGDLFATVTTGRRTFISKIKKWQEQYPDVVNIIAENTDGSIYAQVPASWFRFVRPPRKRKNKDDDQDFDEDED